MFKLAQVTCLVLLWLYLVTASSAQPFSPEQTRAIQIQIDNTITNKLRPLLDEMEARLNKRINELPVRVPTPVPPIHPVHTVPKHTPRRIYYPVYRWYDPCWF